MFTYIYIYITPLHKIMQQGIQSLDSSKSKYNNNNTSVLFDVTAEFYQYPNQHQHSTEFTMPIPLVNNDLYK